MDSVSEERLAEVHPELSRRVRQLAAFLIFQIRVVQGLRTWSQQDALYQQGRTAPGKIVTDAEPGYSMHNFGLAVDVAPIVGGLADWTAGDEYWEAILAKAPACGLAEGAQWRVFPDIPHLYPQELQPEPDDAMRANFAGGGLKAVWDALNLSSGA